MPIQFPVLAGPARSYVEMQWLAQMTKRFGTVPAPNLGRPGALFGDRSPGKTSNGWSFNPGIGLRPDGTKTGAGGATGNVRRPSTMFQAPDQTSVVNPVAMFDEQYAQTVGFDRDLGQQNNRIVGVSRDSTGAALGACTIKVFRTSDDVLVASTTSDGSGNWTAYPNQQGPYYFVEYKAGAPDVFGTSPNTNTATIFTPGQ